MLGTYQQSKAVMLDIVHLAVTFKLQTTSYSPMPC